MIQIHIILKSLSWASELDKWINQHNINLINASSSSVFTSGCVKPDNFFLKLSKDAIIDILDRFKSGRSRYDTVKIY